jgi:hypothetical protein
VTAVNVTPAQPVAPIQAPTQPASAGASPVVPGAKPDSVVPLSALHEERSKRQALADEVASLRAAMDQLKAAPTQPSAAVAPADAQPRGMTQEQVEKLWEEDPKQAVRTEIMLAMNWYDQVNASLEGTADRIAGQNPDFNVVRGQVMNYVRSLPLEQRTPQAIQNAYLMARGQNMDAIIKQREQEWQNRVMAPASFQAPTTGMFGGGAPSAGSVTLTPEQIQAASAMGLKPEDYARFIKK